MKESILKIYMCLVSLFHIATVMFEMYLLGDARRKSSTVRLLQHGLLLESDPGLLAAGAESQQGPSGSSWIVESTDCPRAD